LGLIEPQRALEVLAQEAPDVPQLSSARHFFGPFEFQAGSSWQIVDLEIQLKSPAIATENTLGNVVESRDYLPGTYLLAALNHKLESLLGGPLLSALTAGQLRFSNAYLEVEGQRGLPVPMALFYRKSDGGLESDEPAFNRLIEKQEGSAQEKQYRQGYLANGTDHLVLGKVDIFSTTHGTIEDQHQRPTAAVGGVFTYTALAAGTVLRAQIWLGQGLPQLSEAEIAELSGEYRLGRSKKDDYGWAQIEARTAPLPPPPATGSLLTVWLTSPLLLRSADLASSAAPEELQSYLERELEIKLEPGKSFSRLTRLEGFSTPWGMARPSLIGWAGGSCFAFNYEGKLDPDKLSQLQFQGLGELRGEGFGEVIFNSPVLAQAVWQGRAQASPKTTSAPKGSFSHPLMAQRALRSYIEEKALELGYDPKFRQKDLGWKNDSPPSSQLGNLRSYLEEGDLKALSEWIQHLQDTNNRSGKWEGQAGQALGQLGLNPGQQAWDWLLPETADRSELPEWVWQARHQLDSYAVQAVWLSALHAELREREKSAQEA
jgi:CRISPR-associated protein Csx10